MILIKFFIIAKSFGIISRISKLATFLGLVVNKEPLADFGFPYLSNLLENYAIMKNECISVCF